MRVTDLELAKIVEEKAALVQREAARAFGKMVRQGVIDFDDLVQEGYLALVDAVNYFNPEKTPMKYFDGYVCRALQNRFVNYLWHTHRRLLFLYDEPDQINKVADDLQAAIPTYEDLEIFADLSEDAKLLLEAVFHPSPSLKEKEQTRWNSGKPHCKNLMPLISKELGFQSDKLDEVKCEIRSKCHFEFVS